MSLYTDFETDQKLEQGGKPIYYTGSTRITLARAGGSNRKYRKIMESLTRDYRRQMQADKMDPDVQRDIFAEATARTLIVKWETSVEVTDHETGQSSVEWREGIEGRDGTLMPVTVESMVSTFKVLPDLLDDIYADASNMATFQAVELEGDSENS